MKVILIILMFNSGYGHPVERTYPVDNMETCLKILEASKIDKPMTSDNKVTTVITCGNTK